MPDNLIIIHGGGPTPVLNASLYGAIQQARKHPEIAHIYGAIGGVKGLLSENLVDFRTIDKEALALLLTTPASSIGTARDPLTPDDYQQIAETCERLSIRYLLYNGGNGSMEACGKIRDACAKRVTGYQTFVVGIPKTIDNDLAMTDHCPGFGSAARYIAATTAEVAQDVRSMPIHVCIIEAQGRNAGWITAASALARKKPGDAPHLIYPPERPFDEDAFIADVQMWHQRLGGGVVVVVSEGLKNKDGNPIVPPLFQVGRSVYYGDVGAHLAQLVIRRLGIKSRNEKPGLCGRASMAHLSTVDRDEAITVGAAAVRAACNKESGVMVAIERADSESGYAIRTVMVPIEAVMLRERVLPDEYMNDAGNDVTQSFIDWCRPLIGGALPDYIHFR